MARITIKGYWIFVDGKRGAIASFDNSSKTRQAQDGVKYDLDFRGLISHHKTKASMKEYIKHMLAL